MKILYITHDYGERWIKYAEFIQGFGHEVDLIALKDKRTPGQVTLQEYSSRYDIVWAFAADYIHFKVLTDEFLKAVKDGPCVFVGYCTMNTMIPFKQWVNNFRIFDTCFLHSKLVTQMAKEEGLSNVYYMPYGFDCEEYYPFKVRKKFNLTFVGSPQTNFSPEDDDRVKIINALKSFKIRVWGERFKNRLEKGIKISKFSTHKEMNKIFNQSKINLNVPIINSPLPEFLNKYHPKNRFYEIPGSGSFMLCGYDDEACEQFQEDLHCAYYHSIEDLCEKVEYYLSHEKEIEQIAEAGYQHAVKYHQTKFRFKEMLNILEERYF